MAADKEAYPRPSASIRAIRGHAFDPASQSFFIRIFMTQE